MNIERISETNLIRLLIYNENFRIKCLWRISPELFDDIFCSELFTLIKNTVARESGEIKPEMFPLMIMNNSMGQTKEQIDVKMKIAIPENDTEKEFYTTTPIEDFVIQAETWWKEQKFLNMGIRIGEMIQKKAQSLAEVENYINQIYTFTFDLEKNIVFDTDNDELMIDHWKLEEPRVKLASEHLNKILGGGLRKKSLNVIMGGTHTGKTRVMVSMACDFVKSSPFNKALYVTLEIDKMSISEKKDMNLLNLTEYEIKTLVKTNSEEYIRLRNKDRDIRGKLFVQEYPSGSFSSADLDSLLCDMRRCGNLPQIIFVDYLGIMRTNDNKSNSSEMYINGAVISKELRAVSQKYEIPIVTGVQPRREGNRKSATDMRGSDMMDIGESKAIADNCDFFADIVMTPEMKMNGSQLLKILKNRHSGITEKHLEIRIHKALYKIEFVGVKEDSEIYANTSDNSELERNDMVYGAVPNNSSFKPNFKNKFKPNF